MNDLLELLLSVDAENDMASACFFAMRFER
jgi:hypothetical protein